MHSEHCHVTAIHKQWPPELVLMLKEAKKMQVNGSVDWVSVALAWSVMEFQLSELFAYPNP